MYLYLPQYRLCEYSEGLEMDPCYEGLTEVNLQPLHQGALAVGRKTVLNVMIKNIIAELF